MILNFVILTKSWGEDDVLYSTSSNAKDAEIVKAQKNMWPNTRAKAPGFFKLEPASFFYTSCNRFDIKGRRLIVV